jgi:hypothetical protein
MIHMIALKTKTNFKRIGQEYLYLMKGHDSSV